MGVLSVENLGFSLFSIGAYCRTQRSSSCRMMFFLAAECREQSLNEHSRERPETAKLRGPYRTSRVCSKITPIRTVYMRFADYQDKTKSLQLVLNYGNSLRETMQTVNTMSFTPTHLPFDRR